MCDNTETDNTDIECPICYEPLDSNEITIKCGHKFHYKCILTAFKSNVSKNMRHIRRCPYCRNNSGYLPLRENTYPVKGIHIEHQEIELHLLRNEFDKLKEVTSKYIDKTKCNAILKTGINKSYQCKKNKKKTHDYCHLHLQS
jgi:hypothetical protein